MSAYCTITIIPQAPPTVELMDFVRQYHLEDTVFNTKWGFSINQETGRMIIHTFCYDIGPNERGNFSETMTRKANRIMNKFDLSSRRVKTTVLFEFS